MLPDFVILIHFLWSKPLGKCYQMGKLNIPFKSVKTKETKRNLTRQIGGKINSNISPLSGIKLSVLKFFDDP